MITGAQIRRARELLEWTPWKLARFSRVPSAVIQRAEAVDGEPTITVYQEALIRNALQDAGVEFTKGECPGVNLRRPGPQSVFEKGAIHGHRRMRVAVAATMIRVSATAVSCS
jgi:hypothetical protein